MSEHRHKKSPLSKVRVNSSVWPEQWDRAQLILTSPLRTFVLSWCLLSRRGVIQGSKEDAGEVGGCKWAAEGCGAACP